MSTKRTLDAYFSNPSTNKRPKVVKDQFRRDSADAKPERTPVIIDVDADHSVEPPIPSFSTHPSYPFAIPTLPNTLPSLLPPASTPTIRNDAPDLDLLIFDPYLSRKHARLYGEFLRGELPFYRVSYTLKRYGKEAMINTPRYTASLERSNSLWRCILTQAAPCQTVFGVDVTSKFDPETGELLEASTGRPIKKDKYKSGCKPRPIPQCLDVLRRSVEQATGTEYNFCLVNFYATGSDSISYHSDDEHFLGPNPAIASFSFLATRDFLMRHKPVKDASSTTERSEKGPQEKPLKFTLKSGTMILMRGPTQRNWLHSIPKRADGGEGRINITFRKGVVPYSTENYYQYNVGNGGVYKWDKDRREMRPVIAKQ